MSEASRCYGFPQAFSLSLHEEPGAGALLAGAEPQPWPGCTVGLPVAGGVAPGCSAFLPIRASFYFSPVAVGSAGGTQGCPFSASQGKKKRASDCLSSLSTWQIAPLSPSDPFSPRPNHTAPPLGLPTHPIGEGHGAVGHRPGPGRG